MKKSLILFLILIYSVAFTAQPSTSSSSAKPLTTQPSQQSSSTEIDDNNAPMQDLQDTNLQAPSIKVSKMLWLSVAFILLIFLSFWFLKRLRTKAWRTGETIKILERRPLSQKTVLYLIEVDKERILVGESQAELRVLSKTEILSE